MNGISVVIAIGGRGTRFSKISGTTPKPLFPVNGISTLERTLQQVKENGLDNVILTTCYKSSLFKNFLEKVKSKLKLNISIFEEKFPMGESGALWEVKSQLLDETLFINGDLIFSMDFERLLDFHKRISSTMTLVTHPSSHPEDSDLILSPNGTYIEKLFFKGKKKEEDLSFPILGFSGISVFKTAILNDIRKPNKGDVPNLFGHLIKEFHEKGNRLFSYNTSEYIKDMGTIDRFEKVQKDLKKGLVEKKDYRQKQKALFLDRDNTLIKCDIGQYIVSIKDLVFLDKNIEKIQKVSEEYSMVVIITNQPQIAMNRLSIKDLDSINNIIIKYCFSKNLLIDLVNFCPHHPHKGFKDESNFLKKDCFCRKPNPGMLLQTSFQRNIDLNSSLFIGDSETDRQASINAGCQFINIKDL